MAADERLIDVIEFVQASLSADAELARAALGEPDDDLYLEIEERATSFLAPPLTPRESRWAVPGGTSPHATLGVGDSIPGGQVLAAAKIAAGEPTWIVWVSGLRDGAARNIAEALRIGVVDGELRVVGRAALDPFTAGIRWEDAGGEPVPLDGTVVEALSLEAPGDPDHARWLAERTAP